MYIPLPRHKYRQVQKKHESSGENEIRVKLDRRPFIYAAYAGKLLLDGKHTLIHLTATGMATSKVIQVVEYLRKRLKGLQVAYDICSTEFVDEYQPLEEGLDVVHLKRQVPTLKAFLSRTKSDDLCKMSGYMEPIADKELLDEEKFKKEVEEHFVKRAAFGERKQSGDHKDQHTTRRGPYRKNFNTGGPRGGDGNNRTSGSIGRTNQSGHHQGNYNQGRSDQGNYNQGRNYNQRNNQRGYYQNNQHQNQNQYTGVDHEDRPRKESGSTGRPQRQERNDRQDRPQREERNERPQRQEGQKFNQSNQGSRYQGQRFNNNNDDGRPRFDFKGGNQQRTGPRFEGEERHENSHQGGPSFRKENNSRRW